MSPFAPRMQRRSQAQHRLIGASRTIRGANGDNVPRRIIRLVGIATHPEPQNVSAENIWHLVAFIQRATFRLQDDQLEDSSELTSGLAESPLVTQWIRATAQLAETVALHQSASIDLPAQILGRLLLSIETGDGMASGLNRRHRTAMSCLKDSIHRYLGESLQHENKRQSIDKLVQRSMYHFAYGLSHEINNPLANISARASDLAMRIEGDREKKSLKTIVDQAMKAHEMLAEMMLSVQVPSLTLVYGDVRSLMMELSRGWSAKAQDRSIRWNSEICDDFLWSAFDRVALSEAISAAVRNAFEACRSGDTLTLVAERTESSDGDLEIRIAIIDNGPGLSKKGLDQAWDLYYSGREAGRGLGIGLAKIRRIIDCHQGRVWLASKERQGCTMEIRLPWKKMTSVS